MSEVRKYPEALSTRAATGLPALVIKMLLLINYSNYVNYIKMMPITRTTHLHDSD